jgi:hypothetical protein
MAHSLLADIRNGCGSVGAALQKLTSCLHKLGGLGGGHRKGNPALVDKTLRDLRKLRGFIGHHNHFSRHCLKLREYPQHSPQAERVNKGGCHIG